MKKDVSLKILHGNNDRTVHGVYNIIIYNNVSHNFQFRFRFQDVTLFVGIHE